MREALAEAARVQLIGSEVFLAGAERLLPDMRNMTWHLMMKNTIEQIWRKAWYSPQDYTTYGIWDHMVHRAVKHNKMEVPWATITVDKSLF